MYFRTKTVKDTPLLQLVESFRNSEGLPRQRVIASLGDANIPETERIFKIPVKIFHPLQWPERK